MHPDRFQRPYSYIKGYARRALYLYFDQIKIVNYDEHVPDDGALFFAANHQNTFLDPIIISAFSHKKRQPSFITRSDVFNKRTNAFFKVVKMVPIYRQRDGGSNAIRRNNEMFKVYTERLRHEESMVIFPEGNHGRDRRVRPLKKGLPRIVFQTLEETDFQLPFLIVPVGLYYRDHDKYHTDVLAVFGPPLNAYDYVERYRENKNQGILAMRNDLQEAMEAVNIHIKADHYELVEGARVILGADAAQGLGKDPSDVYERFQAEKVLIRQLETAAANEDPSIPELTELVADYLKQLETHQFRDHVVAEAPHRAGSLFAQAGYLLFWLPVFLYGLLNHLLVYLTLTPLPSKLLKDHVFYPSIRYAAGIIITPLLYLLQTLVVGAFAGPWWALGYFLSLIPSGVLAKQYRDRALKFWSRWRLMRLWRKGDRGLFEMRNRIKSLIMPMLEKDWEPIKQPEPIATAEEQDRQAS